MILLLKISALTVIWVLGLTIVTQEKMAAHGLRRFAEARSGKLWEPIILCEWCMPSIHSIVGFFFGWKLGFYEFNWSIAWYYPLVVMLSSLISGLTWTVYLVLSQLHLAYENANKEYKKQQES